MPNAFDAFDPSRAYQHAEGMRRDRGRIAAGQQMAQGDRGGAIDTLYQGGDLETGNTLERQGVQDKQRAEQMQFDRDEASSRKVKEQGEAFLNVLERVSRVAPGGRKAAFDQLAPMLGVDPQMIATVTEEELADDKIAYAAEQVKSKIKLFNTAGGVVAVDQGALEQDMNDPNASRVVYQDPLQADYKRAQIQATQARAGASGASANAANARAERTRRMPIGPAGGGSSGLPAGFVLD